jgi:urea carboxylase
MPITKLLIANRGEISCRAQKACADLSLPCVAVFTEPDAMSLHVLNAQESVCLGKSPKEYLNADRLLEVCKETGADAVFPGYGFLSENAEFSERCEAAGIAFIGPTGETMRQFSQKHTARELAEKAGVPVLPGTSLLSTGEEALEAAKTIGLPVLLKATGGGGGIGIHMCRTEEEVAQNFASAARQGAAAFGDAGVFVEKYVEHARHIEIQIFGDGQGTVVTFPERECSIQVNQKKPTIIYSIFIQLVIIFFTLNECTNLFFLTYLP